jgi:hypothetical protein
MHVLMNDEWAERESRPIEEGESDHIVDHAVVINWSRVAAVMLPRLWGLDGVVVACRLWARATWVGKCFHEIDVIFAALSEIRFTK